MSWMIRSSMLSPSMLCSLKMSPISNGTMISEGWSVILLVCTPRRRAGSTASAFGTATRLATPIFSMSICSLRNRSTRTMLRIEVSSMTKSMNRSACFGLSFPAFARAAVVMVAFSISSLFVMVDSLLFFRFVPVCCLPIWRKFFCGYCLPP